MLKLAIGCFVAVVMVAAVASGQNERAPLPMSVVQACPLELTDIGKVPRWGGSFARYSVTTNDQGEVVGISRLPWAGREHLEPLVRFDRFEPCVRTWIFGERGEYEVQAGYGGAGDFYIRVTKGPGSLMLRIPPR